MNVRGESWSETYVDGTTAVVLDDLVTRAVSTTTDDVGGAVALDRDGVLADVLEPDILKGARTLAVDTLGLVRTNDDILQGGTILKDEDGVGFSTLALAAAGARATVVLDPLGIEGLASLDVLGLSEGLGAGGCREAAVIAQAGHSCREGGCESNELC